jgi:hypothetical protein
MASAQRVLADMLLKETCPSLAAFLAAGDKDDTTSEVLAAAAAGYKTCKHSLSALQTVKAKYPQAPSSPSLTRSPHHACESNGAPSRDVLPLQLPGSLMSLHKHRTTGAFSRATGAVDDGEGVSITFVRPVASAAASASKDIESFFKCLDAIHFVQSDSNARISKSLGAVYAATRMICAPPSTASTLPSCMQHHASASHPRCSTDVIASLPHKLAFKQPRSVER